MALLKTTPQSAEGVAYALETRCRVWTQWFLAVFATLSLLCILFCEITLRKINENMSLPASVAEQAQNHVLVGRRLIGRDALFKSEMTKRLRPDVLVVGSSTVMQFRKQFFTGESFYTAGGAMPNIWHGLAFIAETMQDYTPKLVILGVDLWWFGPYTEASNSTEFDDAKSILHDNFLQHRRFLYLSLKDKILSGDIPLADIFQFPSYYHALDPIGGRTSIGLAAAQGDGFREDGSYQYGTYISKGRAQNWEDRGLNAVRDGTWRFPYAQHLNKEYVAEFIALLDALKQKGTDIVVFLPPFSHNLYTAIISSRYHKDFFAQFQVAVKTLCLARDIPFYNFSDLANLVSDDGAIDSIHGGERSYATIATHFHDNPALQKYINLPVINTYLAKSTDPLHIIPFNE